jgi:hypothetical protein
MSKNYFQSIIQGHYIEFQSGPELANTQKSFALVLHCFCDPTFAAACQVFAHMTC